jgi:hypothetical protein
MTKTITHEEYERQRNQSFNRIYSGRESEGICPFVKKEEFVYEKRSRGVPLLRFL